MKKVKFTSNIEVKMVTYGVRELDGSITAKEDLIIEGTITTEEEKFIKKWNDDYSTLTYQSTGLTEQVEYNVFVEKNGNGYRFTCEKAKNEGHWIILSVVKGYYGPDIVSAEPYDFSDDPTFDYGDISEAVEMWAEQNLFKQK